VSDIGYKYVELASYGNGKFYGYLPADFKKMVNDLGMEVLSSHAGVNPKGISDDDAKKLGLSQAELAFYDALETNDSAVKVLGDGVLKTIAPETLGLSETYVAILG